MLGWLPGFHLPTYSSEENTNSKYLLLLSHRCSLIFIHQFISSIRFKLLQLEKRERNWLRSDFGINLNSLQSKIEWMIAARKSKALINSILNSFPFRFSSGFASFILSFGVGFSADAEAENWKQTNLSFFSCALSFLN